MWATHPSSPIQLRLPPFPDPYRVIASRLYDSPEETPDGATSDVPSSPQLRAVQENRWDATNVPSHSEGNTVYYNQHLFSSNARSPSQNEPSYDATEGTMQYADDVAPFPRARTRPPFIDSSEESLTPSLGHCPDHRHSITQMTSSPVTMTDHPATLLNRLLRPTLTPNSTSRRVTGSLNHKRPVRCCR